MKRDTRIAWRRTPLASLNLQGTRVAVIGGTGGLGRAISRALAGRGANVIVVGQTFRDADVRGIEFVRADLSSMREAARVARALPAEALDLVVFTTGIFAAPTRQETPEGIERDTAISYLSRYVMLREMAPRLGKERSGPLKPRVFVMGYPGRGQAGTFADLNAEASYNAYAVHMNTVAGNEILVLDAAGRYPHATFFGLNPGLIKTNIRDNFLGAGSLRSRVAEYLISLFAPTPEQYADRVAPLLVAPEIESHSGAMFNQKGQAILPTPALLNQTHASGFLAASEQLVSRATGRATSTGAG
ncbi:MAG: SDR family NAD(P)-dependent oxidoreductase [Vicinamibacterales bacterium]